MDQLRADGHLSDSGTPWTFMEGRKELGHSLTLLSVEYSSG